MAAVRYIYLFRTVGAGSSLLLRKERVVRDANSELVGLAEHGLGL